MESQINRQHISDFYDTFNESEKSRRLNVRHYSIFHQLARLGLKRNHHVLEVGCGFGTVTSLIVSYISRGRIVGTDISRERIAFCQQLFSNHHNASFVLTDMTDFPVREQFDFIVLPDVLEHIPLESHRQLFSTMASLLKDDGTILVHIPHPLMIDYMRENNPSALQIVDQSLRSDHLTQVATMAGLELQYFRAYCLTNSKPDYVTLVFKKYQQYAGKSDISPLRIQLKKLWFRLLYWRKRLL
jgi:trans-aconitate 2-methyltransferase